MEINSSYQQHVPDLSALKRPKVLTDSPVAITVNPGDKVVVLAPPEASAAEVRQLTEYLQNWSGPSVQWLVMIGIQSVTVIPATPSLDSEPQGYDAVLVKHSSKPGPTQAHDPQDCPGPPECL